MIKFQVSFLFGTNWLSSSHLNSPFVEVLIYLEENIWSADFTQLKEIIWKKIEWNKFILYYDH